MNTRHVLRSLPALALSMVLFVPATGRADVYHLHADLDGLQTVPPDASPGFGSADATLDSGSGAFSIDTGSGVYSSLLGGALAVLVNDAPPGSNGPSVMSLTLDTPGATTGTFSGGGTLTAAQITDFIADQGYIRITSQVFPSGEIRGQLFANRVPEPTALVLAGLGGLGILAAARRRRRVS